MQVLCYQQSTNYLLPGSFKNKEVVLKPTSCGVRWQIKQTIGKRREMTANRYTSCSALYGTGASISPTIISSLCLFLVDALERKCRATFWLSLWSLPSAAQHFRRGSSAPSVSSSGGFLHSAKTQRQATDTGNCLLGSFIALSLHFFCIHRGTRLTWLFLLSSRPAQTSDFKTKLQGPEKEMRKNGFQM